MELILDEGRVYGARYYTAKPVTEWWVSAGLDLNPWRDMSKWCTDTFGPTPKNGVWIPSERWYVNDSKFWFRNEKDRTLFILRWA